MDSQDRYDELDNIISTIDALVDDITDKYYIDALVEIKFEAQNELEEVEKKLQEERDQEERNMEQEYWREVI